jgi:DNA-binding NtrC family response regulator
MSVPIQTAATPPTRRNLPVCVLDGDPNQLAHARDLLERDGFTTVGALNPGEALEKIRAGRCRVILADCQVAGTDGLALLEKALQKDRGLHVILMSAVHSVDEAIEAIKHGAYDYLCKPLDSARLTRTLDELSEHLLKSQGAAASPDQDWRPLPLSEMRRIHIQRVLETCNGNRVRAARVLGIGRTSLYRFLKSSGKQATSARASA